MGKMDITIPYYEDTSRVSNSAIGWFIKKGPRYYRDMLDGKEKPLSFSYLEKGTMIHEYILQPEEFWKDYTVLDFETPNSKYQKEMLEVYHNMLKTSPLEDKDFLKLTAYRSVYNNRKSDDVCLDEANHIIDNYSDYLKYLDIGDDRKAISFADLYMLEKIKEHLQEHKKANYLLYELPDTYETHNEFHINWQVDKFDNLKCKSLLDRVCFDHTNKKIILIDLKTTNDVYEFAHSVEEYDYYRQISYYGLAIQWYMQEVLNLNTEDYDFEAYIIAIGKDKEHQIRVFNMKNDAIIRNKVDLIEDTLRRISYHNKINQWDHSIEYYTGDGVEEL